MEKYLVENRQITRFAVHNLRPLRRIAGDNLLLAFGALPIPQFPWIPQRQAFLTSLIRTLPRNRNVHIAIEFEFLRNDFVGLAGDRTPQNLFRDVVWNISNCIRNFVYRTEVLILQILFFKPLPSLYQNLLLRQ